MASGMPPASSSRASSVEPSGYSTPMGQSSNSAPTLSVPNAAVGQTEGDSSKLRTLLSILKKYVQEIYLHSCRPGEIQKWTEIIGLIDNRLFQQVHWCRRHCQCALLLTSTAARASPESRYDCFPGPQDDKKLEGTQLISSAEYWTYIDRPEMVVVCL